MPGRELQHTRRGAWRLCLAPNHDLRSWEKRGPGEGRATAVPHKEELRILLDCAQDAVS